MPRRVTPPPPDARALALAVLRRIHDEAAFADVVLAHALRDARLSPADAALATQLVYGVLAWQGRLDHHLKQLARRPLDRLDAGVRQALQLGVFQLLFLRVPAYAAVNTTVALVREIAGGGAAGFANAVLRRVADAPPEGLPLPSPSRDPLARMAIEWSHPRWLVERWEAEFGRETLPTVLAAHNEPGEITLRTNAFRTTREALATALDGDGITTHPARFVRLALVVEAGAGRIRNTAAFRDGLCSFQGEASQLVVDLLDPQLGERVLDVCAAPGGKATAIAERIGSSGHVVASDLRPSGARRIRDAATRLGVRVDPLVVNAATHALPLTATFDRVLVDAPCSGLGTLRRHPEVRWRRTPGDITALANTQAAILARAAACVRLGGTLVYAVCTRTTEETDAIIAAFLAATPGFVAVDPTPYLPVAVVTDGAFRTMPFSHHLDGFFAVRLQRVS